MKQYLHYFRWVFITVGALAVLYILLWGTRAAGGERRNNECGLKERVFDYGNVLTGEEEARLEKLIEKREKQAKCDIVLVTLRESLEEYAREIEPGADYPEFVRVYAEKFYEDNKFGYNKPNGDGVILVDNWFRERDGLIHTWLCTTGKAKERYDSGKIDALLDKVYVYVEENPYKAYEAYINGFCRDMGGGGLLNGIIPFWIPLAAAAAAMFIFAAMHWKSKLGRDTVLENTYVNGGKPHMNKKEDIFVNKVVTRRHIERSSTNSSGGGGGHSGGGSHGGGGHSR